MTTSIPRRCAELRADYIEKIDGAHARKVYAAMDQHARSTGDRMVPKNWTVDQWIANLKQTAIVAEMWTATPEMVQVMAHAAQSLPPQVLTREMLPSQVGWLYLPEPFLIHDIRGYALPVQVITWAERSIGDKRGVSLAMYTLTGNPLDRLWDKGPDGGPGFTKKEVAAVIAQEGEVSMLHFQALIFGEHNWTVDSTPIKMLDEEARANLVRGAMRKLHTEENLRQSHDGQWTVWHEGHAFKVYPEPVVQFLHTFFHFTRSTLASKDVETLPKSSARWLRRLGLANSPITIVRLRRHAPGAPTGQSWQLTYRYIRRGHWRRQWYGSGDKRWQEHIFILPTIVGPDDGELRIRDVVNLVQY